MFWHYIYVTISSWNIWTHQKQTLKDRKACLWRKYIAEELALWIHNSLTCQLLTRHVSCLTNNKNGGLKHMQIPSNMKSLNNALGEHWALETIPAGSDRSWRPDSISIRWGVGQTGFTAHSKRIAISSSVESGGTEFPVASKNRVQVFRISTSG